MLKSKSELTHCLMPTQTYGNIRSMFCLHMFECCTLYGIKSGREMFITITSHTNLTILRNHRFYGYVLRHEIVN